MPLKLNKPPLVGENNRNTGSIKLNGSSGTEQNAQESYHGSAGTIVPDATEQQTVTDRMNVKPRELEEWERVKDELYGDFITDMESSALDVEMDEEQIKRAKKRHRSTKIKRIVLYVAMISLFVGLLGFGVFNTFFKHEWSQQEIAQIANAWNGRTNFPQDGVQGYLNSNIAALVSDKITFNVKVEKSEVYDPVVTKIYTKDDLNAHVYFYFTSETGEGKVQLNGMCALNWDPEKGVYRPMGDVIISPMDSANALTDEISNPYLSFGDAKEVDEEVSKNSKVFIDNFFTLLYTDQSIDPYYDGSDELKSYGYKYAGITEYHHYLSENKNGYNVKCVITLEMDNGIFYSTDRYVKLEQSGESWMVKGVL